VRVLIVEDEAAHAQAICRAFERANFATEVTVIGLLAEYRQLIAVRPPQIQTQPTIPLPAPPALRIPPAPVGPPPAPPPPPPPRFAPKDPQPRGNPGNWATTNDYPSRALREDREGTTAFRVTVGADGRVQSCTITRSSGHADLDDATCKNITRRARFNPATDGSGNEVSGTWSSQVRWQIPD
jgi:protein TonB